MSIPLASSNRSAVNHQRRTIQSPHRNQTPWHVLVATGDGDQSIVPLAAHDRFDRIGNQIPGLKRERHAIGAHADPIADPYGVKPHTDEPLGLHRLLGSQPQIQKVHVARIALEPNTGDPDLGFVHVLRRETCRIEHRLRGPLTLRLGNAGRVLVDRRGHKTTDSYG